jgi:hypothetical protein
MYGRSDRLSSFRVARALRKIPDQMGFILARRTRSLSPPLYSQDQVFKESLDTCLNYMIKSADILSKFSATTSESDTRKSNK